MKANFYRSLPSDLNTPNPFSTGYKCHQPSGKYIGKKNTIHLKVWKNNFKMDWKYKENDEKVNKITE